MACLAEHAKAVRACWFVASHAESVLKVCVCAKSWYVALDAFSVWRLLILVPCKLLKLFCLGWLCR